MLKVVKRLPIALSLVAIGFLIIQIVCALYLPLLTADIVDNGIRVSDVAYIQSKGAIMIALSVVSMAGALANTFLFSRISYKLGGELRADVYKKVLSFSKYEFDKIGTSSLITRTTNDVTQVQTLVEGGLKFLIMAPAMLFGGIILTALLSVKLALIFLCTVPILAISYVVIYRYASPLYAKMQALLDKLNLSFREGLTGVKVIRAFGKEETEYERYKTVNSDYTHNSITAGTLMSVAIPLVTLLVSLAVVAIAWIGVGGIGDGTVETGAIMAAISYSAQILMGFGMLTNVILSVPRGQTSAKRIYEVIDMPITVNETETPQTVNDAALEFNNVDFRYRGAERKTLEDISFSAKAGQTLAIIGSTGDGKSTIVNLISRLYDAESGAIKIGGVDIRDMEQKKLRELVSLTPQKSTLFFGTVRDNLLAAKPNATDDEMWAALKMASAAEFVQTLDDAVEKGGGNFSGGEKQRLCIARTLLKDAMIYVFDDSFSALDFKTDAEVRAAMRDKTKNAITVIVAQRISTVMTADMIVVLNNGKTAGVGTHKTLKADNKIYQEIIDSQFYKEGAAA